MGTLVISTNTSLDGVVQDPDGQEDFARGGWFDQFGAKDLDEWREVETAEAKNADALLLGRRSDTWFASRWESRGGDWADRLNALPKFVVSATLDQPRWGNATVLRGDLLAEVARLKLEIDGEILVYASYQLARVLLDNDLVDEVRLFVFPVVVGAGERLFGDTRGTKPLRLRSTRTVGDNLVFMSYEVIH